MNIISFSLCLFHVVQVQKAVLLDGGTDEVKNSNRISIKYTDLV